LLLGFLIAQKKENKYLRNREIYKDIDDIIRNRNNIFSIAIVSVLTISIIGIIAYLILTQKICLEIDFPYFLSLVVAFFSLCLSIAFYFKASETSNKFYDNTYKFTKDISEKIGRMDERFGERLTHIDQDINRHLDIDKNVIDQTEKEIKKEKKEVSDISNSREALFDELLKKKDVSEDEKKEIIRKINELIEKETDKKQKILKLENKINSTFLDANSVIAQLKEKGNISPTDFDIEKKSKKLSDKVSEYEASFMPYDKLIIYFLHILCINNKLVIDRRSLVIQKLIAQGYINLDMCVQISESIS
jgi:hypothetical protein